MRFPTLFALPLLGLITTTVVAQQPTRQTPPEGGTPKPFTLPAGETLTLPNGLGVTLVPYGLVPKVSASLIIDVGNVDETARQIWLADLTADLMKEGTTTKSSTEIAEAMARMGGNLSVSVGPNLTTVATDVLSEFTGDAVAMLAEVVEKPLMPASELGRLKADLARNLSLALSQPGSLAQARFSAVLYPDHPYGRIFPTQEMIEAYTLEDVKAFHRAHFAASRSHLYIVGRFDRDVVRKRIQEVFAGWQKGSPAERPKASPVGARTLHVIDRPGAPQSTVYLGGPVIDPSNPDYVALQVSNALLGGSFGSRITSNIREQKGYTYSPTSQLVSRPKVAHWVEMADVTTASTGPAIKEILFEIDRLRNEAPGEEELAGIRNYVSGVFVLQNSSRAGITNQLAFTRLHGLGPEYLATMVQRINAVTPADVQRIARTYFDPAKMTLVVVGDKAAIAGQLEPYGPPVP